MTARGWAGVAALALAAVRPPGAAAQEGMGIFVVTAFIAGSGGG